MHDNLCQVVLHVTVPICMLVVLHVSVPNLCAGCVARQCTNLCAGCFTSLYPIYVPVVLRVTVPTLHASCHGSPCPPEGVVTLPGAPPPPVHPPGGLASLWGVDKEDVIQRNVHVKR